VGAKAESEKVDRGTQETRVGAKNGKYREKEGGTRSNFTQRCRWKKCIEDIEEGKNWVNNTEVEISLTRPHQEERTGGEG